MNNQAINNTSSVTALQDLSSTNLDQTKLEKGYRDTLFSIEEQYCNTTRKLLRWLAFSKAPLAIEEIADILIISGTLTISLNPAIGFEFAGKDLLEHFSSLICISTVKNDDVEQ